MVVALEPDVGLEAASLHARATNSWQDERAVEEIQASPASSSRPDRATARRPVALGEDDADRVVQQVGPLDGVVLGQRYEVVLVDQSEVELARLHAGDARKRVGLGERELDGGVAASECADGLRHDRRVGGGKRGEAEHSAAQAGDRLDLGLGGGEAGDDPVGVRDERAAGLRSGARSAGRARRGPHPPRARASRSAGETADGVKASAWAAAAIEPCSATAPQDPHPSNVEHKRILVNHKKIQWW